MSWLIVKVKVTLRLTVSQSVSLGVELMTRYLLLFDSYGIVFCGAPSLTRGRVCLLYMLLALSSAVFLGSESLGTRNRIILPQIWNFHFRRLLRLAGSPWRYSTPPPHGSWLIVPNVLVIKSRHGPHRKHRFLLLLSYSLPCERSQFIRLISRWLYSNGCTRCIIYFYNLNSL
jgi:hypothetical protein